MSRLKASAPLEQNPHVKELLSVLDAHKSPGAEDLRAMLGNVAKMEAELAAMRRELETIREENHPLRKAVQNAVMTMQAQVLKLREQLDALKTAIVDGCRNALAAFKERGASALNGVARFFRVRPALEKIAAAAEQGERRNVQAVSKIEAVSAEVHETGRHLRNLGRVITGKDPLPEAKPVGRVAKAVEIPFKAARACNEAIWYQAQGALESLSRLEKHAGRPAPIREQYDKAAGEAARHNARQSERSRPAPAHEDR